MLVGQARLKISRSIAARTGFSCGLAIFALLFGSRALQTAVAEGDTRTISLHHIHTNEDITITFKRDGRYDEAALEKLNWFLRDWRREEATRMDPHLIDLVWEVQRESGSTAPIWVVCGYRSPQTNAMLRRRSHGVAKFSQHMLGHAMDFYVPGVRLDELRAIGLRLQRGGVGFYPSSGSPFVHMDTGSIRHWPRMTREQLARVFPDGRTVHIPTDGRPLPGYALALADIKARGGSPSEMSIDAARSAGVDVAEAGAPPSKKSLFAKIFHLNKNGDEEDNDVDVAAPEETASNAAAVPLRTRAKEAVATAIASAESKLAAEKTKLAKVAAKAHVITRAEAAPAPVEGRLATLTPSEIVRARGYWSGLADGGAAARPATSAVEAVAAVSRPGAAPRVIEAEDTGTVGADGAGQAHMSPALALAYAEQGAPDTAPRVLTVATIAAAAPPAAAGGAAQTGQNAMTVAVKRVSGHAASAIFTVAGRPQSAADAGAAINDPWLRAVLMSPSVYRFLTVTALGHRDARALVAMMVKPDNAVMMTFSADPQLGLTHDRFSGSAIVSVPTVSYPQRSASLR